jgi:acyl carrier protein
MDDKLRHIMALVLEMPEDQVTDRLTAADTTNWDSIRHLNLVMALEEAYGVTFSSDEMGSLDSYASIAAAIARAQR